MLRRLTGLLAAAVLLARLSGAALAHDGWVQSYAPVVLTGEMAYVDLQFGNHSNEHGSYRIAGKWPVGHTQVFVTGPMGDRHDITATLFDTGEAVDTSPAGPKGFYTAAFAAGGAGIYVVSVQSDSLFTYPDGKTSRTLRSAKSFVAAANLPVPEQVSALQGFDRAVSEDRAELIPLRNPAALLQGAAVPVKLLVEGKPSANQEVTVVRRSTGDVERLKTDDTGQVQFTPVAADYYLLRAKVDATAPGAANTTAHEATLTLIVQRGGYETAAPAPAGGAGGAAGAKVPWGWAAAALALGGLGFGLGRLGRGREAGR